MYISEWGSFGIIEPGKFNLAQQIAVDDERNIYVADTGNSRIQKFTNSGEFLSSFEINGVKDGELQSPVGIAIYENNVYVVDDKQHNVQKFDGDGNFILKWGGFGINDGEFNQPKGITIDSNGIVYVTDSKNHRIQKFTSDGEFLLAFGVYGSNARLVGNYSPIQPGYLCSSPCSKYDVWLCRKLVGCLEHSNFRQFCDCYDPTC